MNTQNAGETAPLLAPTSNKRPSYAAPSSVRNGVATALVAGCVVAVLAVSGRLAPETARVLQPQTAGLPASAAMGKAPAHRDVAAVGNFFTDAWDASVGALVSGAKLEETVVPAPEEAPEYDEVSHDYADAPGPNGSDFYPGTQGCEATCEGDSIDEEACAANGSFCEWAENKCWSMVGPDPCPTDWGDFEADASGYGRDDQDAEMDHAEVDEAEAPAPVPTHDDDDDAYAPGPNGYGSDFYPGTAGCESTCEGNEIDEHACAAIGPFCEWDENKCWSAVGPDPCPTDFGDVADAPDSGPDHMPKRPKEHDEVEAPAPVPMHDDKAEAPKRALKKEPKKTAPAPEPKRNDTAAPGPMPVTMKDEFYAAPAVDTLGSLESLHWTTFDKDGKETLVHETHDALTDAKAKRADISAKHVAKHREFDAAKAAIEDTKKGTPKISKAEPKTGKKEKESHHDSHRSHELHELHAHELHELHAQRADEKVSKKASDTVSEPKEKEVEQVKHEATHATGSVTRKHAPSLFEDEVFRGDIANGVSDDVIGDIIRTKMADHAYTGALEDLSLKHFDFRVSFKVNVAGSKCPDVSEEVFQKGVKEFIKKARANDARARFGVDERSPLEKVTERYSKPVVDPASLLDDGLDSVLKSMTVGSCEEFSGNPLDLSDEAKRHAFEVTLVIPRADASTNAEEIANRVSELFDTNHVKKQLEQIHVTKEREDATDVIVGDVVVHGMIAVVEKEGKH